MAMGVPAFAGAFAGGFLGHRLSESLLISVVGLLVLWQGVELLGRRRQSVPAGARDELEGGHGVFSPTRLMAEAGIGLTVGFLGGAVGLILGSLRLPALIRILRVDPRIAAGTNLFIGFIMGSVGWAGHFVHGEVDYSLLVPMGIAAMIGSYLGARLTGRVSLDTLITTMGWVLLAVGGVLLWQGIWR